MVIQIWGILKEKMRPDKTAEVCNLSFSGTPLEDFIDKRHELVKLSKAISWDYLEEVFVKYYKETGRKGKNIRLLLGLQIIVIHEKSIG